MIWSFALSVLFILSAVFLGYYYVFSQMGAQCFVDDTCNEALWPVADAGIYVVPVLILIAVWVFIGFRVRAGRKIWMVWTLGFTVLLINTFVWMIVRGYAMGIPSLMIFGGAPV
jgi:hypothetical protein